MEYLKIQDNKGLFYREGEGMVEVNRMTKDDLCKLVRLALSSEEFEMTPYDEALLQNPAHKTIYSHIYRQLLEISGRKQEFNAEINSLYKEAYDKYCTE
jgi:hypothetical protein